MTYVYSTPKARGWLSCGVLALATSLSGCGAVTYVKSELSGTAKPEGGIQEAVPPSKAYNTTPAALRQAALTVLEELGYVYEENASTGTIKTEPKLLTDTSKFALMGATYSAKLFIKLEGATITYRAKFDKKSNVTMPEQNIEYPEKENEIRKEFFAALDKRVTPASGAPSRVAPPAAAPAPVAATEPPKTSSSQSASAEAMSIAEMQKTLLGLGYQPGPADGANGKRTVDALKKFQQANKLPATGTLDADTIRALRRARSGN